MKFHSLKIRKVLSLTCKFEFSDPLSELVLAPAATSASVITAPATVRPRDDLKETRLCI